MKCHFCLISDVLLKVRSVPSCSLAVNVEEEGLETIAPGLGRVQLID